MMLITWNIDTMAEDYRERQEDELQVLQAIYMEDVEDLRKPAVWKVDFHFLQIY